MDVKDSIEERRAYRSLEPVNITEELIEELARSAQLSPSCFNNQPWRYVFVYDRERLNQMRDALSEGNKWAHRASMIVAVLSKKEFDCVIKDREYFLFDTGLATAFMILRATELGLVAHPIAGYNPKKVREILNIPDDLKVVTLVIVGKHSREINPLLTDKQTKTERKRPERKPLEEIIYKNSFG